MRPMDFRDFWYSLSDERREQFITDIGSSWSQIRNYYLTKNPQKRHRPTNQRMALMVLHSGQRLSIDSVLNYFVGEHIRIEVYNLLDAQNEESPNVQKNAGANQVIQQQ